MRSSELLLSLICVASITGAFLHGNLKQVTSVKSPKDTNSKVEIEFLKKQNSELEQELILQRQLANTPSEIAVDPAWVEFVEEHVGYLFKEPPHVIKGMVDEMTKFAANEWLVHFGKDGLADRDYLFYQIGLLPKTSMEIKLSMLSSGFGYKRALYDHLSKRVVVATDFDVKSFQDKKALVEALAICLLEQHHSIDTSLTDDAFAARRMVIQGQALLTQDAFDAYTRQQMRITESMEMLPIPDEMRQTILQEMENTPIYLQYLDTSPALFGKRFLKKLNQELGNPKDAVELALKKAHSSLSVILSEETSSASFDENETAIVSTSIGAMGVFAHLLQDKSVDKPLTITKSFVSDKLECYLDSIQQQPASRVHWTINFSSEAAAIAFEKHLRQNVKKLAVIREAGRVEASCSEIFSSHDIQ